MSVTITINGTPYNCPTQGQSPPWGEDLTDIILALTEVANNVAGTGDITKTTFLFANNQASAANITGLSFDSSLIRGAIVDYSIYRSTSLAEESETGQIYLNYKSTANTWEFAQVASGSCGITLSITSLGQMQYTSTNLSGTSYSGKIVFTAKAFTQT